MIDRADITLLRSLVAEEQRTAAARLAHAAKSGVGPEQGPEQAAFYRAILTKLASLDRKLTSPHAASALERAVAADDATEADQEEHEA